MDVSSNNLGPDGKAAIGNALLRNLDSKLGFMNCDEWQLHEDMTTLNVANKQLTVEDAVLLAGVLAHNKIVTQVEAFGNMIGPERGHAFAKALETNTCIQELTLGSRSKPASIPLKSLRENSVNTLDYSGKELFSEGGIVLAFMLRSNTSVTKVSARF